MVIVSVPNELPKRSSVTFKTKVHFDITTATMSTKKAALPGSTSDTKADGDQNVSLSTKRKYTPNFERMHQKNFSRQKSITSCVNRDKKINVNMDKAFDEAQHQGAFVKNSATVAEETQENVEPNLVKAAKTFVTKRNKPTSSRSKETSEIHHLGPLLVDEPLKKRAKVEPESSRRKTTAMLEHTKKVVPAVTSNKRKSAAVVAVEMANPFKNIVA